MAFCNRTLAIKAALGAGFLLILLNLLNSKLDSSTTPNTYSRFGATHWPKRTHASSERQSLPSSDTDGGKGNILAQQKDHQQTDNDTSPGIDELSKEIQNASKFALPSGAVDLISRHNISLGGNNSNLPQNGEQYMRGVTGALRGVISRPKYLKKQQNVIQNLKNKSTNRTNITLGEKMGGNKTNNDDSNNVTSLNDISNTSGTGSYNSIISNSNGTTRRSNEMKNNFKPKSESVGKNNTTIGASNIVESHTALPAKQDAIVSASPRIGDIPEFSIDSNRVDEGTLRNFFDKFTINSCPPIPPNLDGPIDVDVTYEPLSVIEKRFTDKLQPGGQYAPPDCTARNRVAIIVPYRDREQHLPIFLKNIHALLMKQQLEYGIYIVEQTAGSSFNRAALMNIGFVEAMKQKNWECMVFHDIDLLPMDDRNLYSCPDQPRHMSVAVDTFSFKLPYSTIFGGVSAMTEKQFRMVNGFSNSFWGWGGEDDDMSNRLKHVGFHIARYPVNIARYTMLNHKKEKANPKRYEKLVNGAKRYDSDGLNSLHYQLVNLIRKPLYTWIHVEISPDGS
ncbi:beta-1,4-N-acetylgalactosaminyltransferase bre-4 [Anopheles ziemanni]|uniref:beta-1,4-N-acetylgalactosaminyltransferase bre-4 n=1 Tax=Anopheles coustani TaxID=139045 RepID=UPI002658C1EF|nr:beta-1,4-N-acetylgalactosaminyltransferase bre-4 [Anopheles coustani]XP_058177859.1 beta-1,4-N-acetylgalactosaminyltransferase bre-4 [Anopheles ziemanni]